jgi:hypothetical protein
VPKVDLGTHTQYRHQASGTYKMMLGPCLFVVVSVFMSLVSPELSSELLKEVIVFLLSRDFSAEVTHDFKEVNFRLFSQLFSLFLGVNRTP